MLLEKAIMTLGTTAIVVGVVLLILHRLLCQKEKRFLLDQLAVPNFLYDKRIDFGRNHGLVLVGRLYLIRLYLLRVHLLLCGQTLSLILQFDSYIRISSAEPVTESAFGKSIGTIDLGEVRYSSLILNVLAPAIFAAIPALCFRLLFCTRSLVDMIVLSDLSCCISPTIQEIAAVRAQGLSNFVLCLNMSI